MEICRNNYTLKGDRSSQQTVPMVTKGLCRAGRMSCCFTEARVSWRKFVIVNGMVLREIGTCQAEALW